ncbi:HlyD family secretion protein [Zavarzinella formosa]|uniref:HlyD family secretion protein n=1 Tax=Zavarzinella formosa TaxID=360055 RepID=UPI0003794C1B|nr:HlyD family secretion protein [Zavarzinella formosa]
MLFRYGLPLLAFASMMFALRHVVIADQEPPKQPPPVEPSRTPFKSALAGGGVIEPKSENIAIGSHLPGVVAEVFANVNDEVEAGQKLFRLDNRQLLAELEVRQAMLESSRSSLEKLRSQPRPEEIPITEATVQEARVMVEDTKAQFARAERGHSSGAVSEEEYVRQKYAVATANAKLTKAEAELRLLRSGAWKSDLSVAEAQVKQAQAQVLQTETELKRLEVTAPVKGRVLQKNVRPGEYVGIPPGQALMVIGDVSTLHVRMDVDENDISRFKKDLVGKAITRGANKREVSLKFVRVEPYVVAKKSLTGSGTERVDTRVLNVIYAIETKDPNLYVGQQVDVYLDAAK